MLLDVESSRGRQTTRRRLPGELPKPLPRKAAAAERAVLGAGGEASSSEPASCAQPRGYETAPLLEDAAFCLFVFFIAGKARKRLPWSGITRLLGCEKCRRGMAWQKEGMADCSHTHLKPLQFLLLW